MQASGSLSSSGHWPFCIESACCFSERPQFPFLSRFNYARRNGLQRPTGSVASDLLAKWRPFPPLYRARMSVWGQSLPKRDVHVTSVHPSISDMMLQRRERRNGPLGDVARALLKDERGDPTEASKKKSPQLGAGGWGFRGGTHATCHPDLKRFPELSGLLRCSASRGWSARLDIDCLSGLYGLRGLLDREMQYALVEMSVDGSVLWLEWQGHRSIE